MYIKFIVLLIVNLDARWGGGVSGQNHVPTALPPWKNTDIDWIGFWFGPVVSLDVLEEETLMSLSEFGGCCYIIHRCLKPRTSAKKGCGSSEDIWRFFSNYSLYIRRQCGCLVKYVQPVQLDIVVPWNFRLYLWYYNVKLGWKRMFNKHTCVTLVH